MHVIPTSFSLVTEVSNVAAKPFPQYLSLVALLQEQLISEKTSSQQYSRGLRAIARSTHWSYFCSVKESHCTEPLMAHCQNANGKMVKNLKFTKHWDTDELSYSVFSHYASLSLKEAHWFSASSNLNFSIQQDLHYEAF